MLVLTVEQMDILISKGLDCTKASMFYHEKEEYTIPHKVVSKDIFNYGHNIIPAFTLEDILNILPKYIRKNKEVYQLIFYLSDKALIYSNMSKMTPSLCVRCYPTLIEAAYEMLIWCLDNKYIK